MEVVADEEERLRSQLGDGVGEAIAGVHPAHPGGAPRGSES
jgi:hypothetical protein